MTKTKLFKVRLGFELDIEAKNSYEAKQAGTIIFGNLLNVDGDEEIPELKIFDIKLAKQIGGR